MSVYFNDGGRKLFYEYESPYEVPSFVEEQQSEIDPRIEYYKDLQFSFPKAYKEFKKSTQSDSHLLFLLTLVRDQKESERDQVVELLSANLSLIALEELKKGETVCPKPRKKINEIEEEVEIETPPIEKFLNILGYNQYKYKRIFQLLDFLLAAERIIENTQGEDRSTVMESVFKIFYKGSEASMMVGEALEFMEGTNIKPSVALKIVYSLEECLRREEKIYVSKRKALEIFKFYIANVPKLATDDTLFVMLWLSEEQDRFRLFDLFKYRIINLIQPLENPNRTISNICLVADELDENFFDTREYYMTLLGFKHRPDLFMASNMDIGFLSNYDPDVLKKIGKKIREIEFSNDIQLLSFIKGLLNFPENEWDQWIDIAKKFGEPGRLLEINKKPELRDYYLLAYKYNIFVRSPYAILKNVPEKTIIDLLPLLNRFDETARSRIIFNLHLNQYTPKEFTRLPQIVSYIQNHSKIVTADQMYEWINYLQEDENFEKILEPDDLTSLMEKQAKLT